MKIAVASDDGISIAQHFGRCAVFEIFEVTGSEVTRIESRPNSNSRHHPRQDDCGRHDHHEGVHGHGLFVNALHDCQAVICRGMGRRAVIDLAGKNIKPVIITQDVSILEAVRLYGRGELNSSGDSRCCSH